MKSDHVIVLKSNIDSEKMKEVLTPHMDNHTSITQWSVDLEDVDKVLRIETSTFMLEKDVINYIGAIGFKIEVLDEPEYTCIQS